MHIRANYAKFKLYVYVSIGAPADAASWSKIAVFLLTNRENKISNIVLVVTKQYQFAVDTGILLSSME